MAYNKAREEQKWKNWKEREEDKLRELGMDEASIQALRESDWADFNSERRYQEHQIPLLDYMELLLAETEICEDQIQSVEELLDAIGDERLLHILLEADRKTLQIVVLKMMGGICPKGDWFSYWHAGADGLYETKAVTGKNKKNCES